MDDLAGLPDEQLAQLVQGNNHQALGVLMDRYQDRLLRYGRRFLSQDAPIDDAVQDVFIKVYQNIQSYDPSMRFAPWVYRIAHNEFISSWRRMSRAPIAVDFDTLVAHPSYEIDPAGDEERRLMKEQVERGLTQVSPIYKEVLILYYLEDLSYQEISDILRVPVGTVGVRLRRAREAIKKHLHHE